MEDWKVDRRVKIKTTVDEVQSMEGKGQYIYVSVVGAGEEGKPVEPIFKFNNGFEGGSSEALFNDKYSADPQGMFHALYKDKIDPLLREWLGEPKPE
mmetsp:Transcript_48716/g.153153  ORF Transcript_48716/g.153153 Transcript_48716/m.153153 type:complete len:97 (-) Transcript_48716:99-389(-)